MEKKKSLSFHYAPILDEALVSLPQIREESAVYPHTLHSQYPTRDTAWILLAFLPSADICSLCCLSPSVHSSGFVQTSSSVLFLF